MKKKRNMTNKTHFLFFLYNAYSIGASAGGSMTETLVSTVFRTSIISAVGIKTFVAGNLLTPVYFLTTTNQTTISRTTINNNTMRSPFFFFINLI